MKEMQSEAHKSIQKMMSAMSVADKVDPAHKHDEDCE